MNIIKLKKFINKLNFKNIKEYLDTYLKLYMTLLCDIKQENANLIVVEGSCHPSLTLTILDSVSTT